MNAEQFATPATLEVSQDAVNVVEVQNPTAEEMVSLTSSIKANFNCKVDVKATEFKFRKSVDKDTKIETLRKPVELAVPYPSVEGIIDILEHGGKQLELLMDAVESVVNATARDMLYDDLSLTAATFPVDKLSWAAISEIPKAQRRGGGIPKETWDDFAADYIECMPSITGKSVQAVSNAAKLMLGKLQAAKTNEPVLNLVIEQLSVYMEHGPNSSEFIDCVDFLLKKAETFLNVSTEDLLANL